MRVRVVREGVLLVIVVMYIDYLRLEVYTLPSGRLALAPRASRHPAFCTQAPGNIFVIVPRYPSGVLTA